jgi:hypothetical protein
MRDLRQRERKFAEKIAPGNTNWADAAFAFYHSVGRAGSPIKRARMINELTNFLNETVGEGAHFLLDCGGAKRSAGLMFATLSAGENPFLGVNEEGVNITTHNIISHRNGDLRVLPDMGIAYVSKHAIGRLHERGHDLDNMKATCVLACVGILGLLTRDSAKHVDGGLCLRYDDTLIVGSLKHALKCVNGKDDINATLFDVRTALLADSVTDQQMLTQGAWATNAVAKWLDDRTVARSVNLQLAETIPFIPRRDDFTTQHAVEDQRSKQ